MWKNIGVALFLGGALCAAHPCHAGFTNASGDVYPANPDFEVRLSFPDQVNDTPAYLEVTTPDGTILNQNVLLSSQTPVKGTYYDINPCSNHETPVRVGQWENFAWYHNDEGVLDGQYTIRVKDMGENCLGSNGEFKLEVYHLGVLVHSHTGHSYDDEIGVGGVAHQYVLQFPLPSTIPNADAWKDLISYRPPVAMQNNLLSRDMYAEELEVAAGVRNLDLYSVSFPNMPINPATGKRFTGPQEFLEYVRLHFNDFFDEPRFFPYSRSDGSLWGSSTPVGSVMRIDLGGFQWGDVVTSQHVLQIPNLGASYWRFSTVHTPEDGSHPVAGTRDFGIQRTSRGWVFFTRAADGSYVGDPEFIFSQGDKFWRDFIEHFASFVKSNGGGTPTLDLNSTGFHPKWWPLCAKYWMPTVPWITDSVVRDPELCANYK